MNYNAVTRHTGVPYGIGDMLARSDDWRDRFAWPIAPRTVFDIAERLMNRSDDLIIGNSGPARRILLLIRTFNRAAALLEAAVAVQHERDFGVKLEGPRDLAVLRGELDAESAASDTMSMTPSGGRANLAWLRQVARTKTWTPWHAMPKAMLAPDGVVITHNELLINDLRGRPERLRFDAADRLIGELTAGCDPRASLFSSPGERNAAAERIVDGLVDEPLLSAEMRDRVRNLLRPIVMVDVEKADRLLAQLDGARELPRQIWSGTGGFYPSRALGLAVMERGGRARRYDHGGTASLMADENFLGYQELAVSTEFVMPTPLAATTIERAAKRMAPVPVAQIFGSRGDPSLDPGSVWRRAAIPSRRRVLYVAGAYYGFSQTFPPYPPPTVYADWQHRLLTALARLPVNLRHKPHPGGLLKGKPDFLAGYAPVLGGWFEDALGETDVVVIDLAATTTLAIAMCTDRPIVVLDFGCMPFNDIVREQIARRCRLVPVATDARNRFVVDEAALTDAICGGPEREDPSYFRALFLGEESGAAKQ